MQPDFPKSESRSNFVLPTGELPLRMKRFTKSIEIVMTPCVWVCLSMTHACAGACVQLSMSQWSWHRWGSALCEFEWVCACRTYFSGCEWASIQAQVRTSVRMCPAEINSTKEVLIYKNVVRMCVCIHIWWFRGSEWHRVRHASIGGPGSWRFSLSLKIPEQYGAHTLPKVFDPTLLLHFDRAICHHKRHLCLPQMILRGSAFDASYYRSCGRSFDYDSLERRHICCVV